jgi:predicted AAA+ superfamily ATPase
VTGSARLNFYRHGGDSLQGRYHLLRLHPLSVNALREDLQVAHKTVANWLRILERLYAIFRLAPFGAPRLRAVKKEQKHYQFDWTLVPDPAARFENLVASHLLKWVHFEQDAKGRDLELRYFRDRDGREVDFVVTEKGAPLWFVEAKSADADVSSSLRSLKVRFPKAEAWQVSAAGTKDYVSPEGIRVAPATLFLSTLV